jgi:hypothetical protein
MKRIDEKKRSVRDFLMHVVAVFWSAPGNYLCVFFFVFSCAFFAIITVIISSTEGSSCCSIESMKRIDEKQHKEVFGGFADLIFFLMFGFLARQVCS